MAPELINTAWIVSCAALVLFMQAGFCCLEAGLVRTKNSINVAAKNITDLMVSGMIYWAVGYALMFGATCSGWFGVSGFFYEGADGSYAVSVFVFQLMFCGTATTLVAGAVAERIKFLGYLVIALLVSALIYPVFGHWVWGGGWLSKLGYLDFAGGSVVHCVGAWVALAACLVIGPRQGRFGVDAKTIEPHNVPYAALGVLILLFGWVGFNGGSTLELSENVPLIIAATVLAAMAGGAAPLALGCFRGGRVDVVSVFNGLLSGLVAITACAHCVSLSSAVVIGIVAGGLSRLGSLLLEKLRIDDAVGVFPVHGVAGVWGVLCVALFGIPSHWGNGFTPWQQLQAQAAGIAACCVWSFGVAFVALTIVNRFFPLRITAEMERVGLNVAEHGAASELQELLSVMQAHQEDEDSISRVDLESHTEVGQITSQYNRVLAAMGKKRRELESAYEELRLAKNEANATARHLSAQLNALDRGQCRVEYDAAGKVMDANVNFLRAVGYSLQQVKGKRLAYFLHRDDQQSFDQDSFWSRIAQTGFESGVRRFESKSGQCVWLHSMYFSVLDEFGEIDRYIEYCTDITEQKRVEEESYQAQQRLANLAHLIRESPNEMYLVNQKDLRFMEVNRGATESCGYSQQELHGMTLADISSDLDAESFRELTNPLVSCEKEVVELKTTMRRKDGTTYPAQVSLHSAHYDDTPVFVAFAMDLSQLEKLELQLSQAQKLESIGQLAAGVAHEINTPMQFLKDNIEYLSDCSDKLFRVVDAYRSLAKEDTLAETWSEKVEEVEELAAACRFERIREQMPAAIEESREGVERTVRIVRAMKEFSHPGAKDMRPENLNQLIESTVAISRNRWKYAAELALELDPNLAEAPMLASEINQVLLNLIVNAGDAIAEKNEAREGALGVITVRTYNEASHVVVEVSDDGCGMPEHVIQRVFEPFFTTKEVGKGTGQGLAITHNVVANMHGGEVLIDSQEGVGTTFTVKLLRAAEGAPQAGLALAGSAN